MTTNERVLALVERELRKNPELTSADLRVKAAKIDPDVGELNGRQFHARYTIQARKRLPKSPGATRRKKPAARKTKPRKAGRVRRLIKRGARSASTGDDAAAQILAGVYQDKSTELNEAVKEAFERAVDADSLKKMNALLATLDEQTQAMRRI